MVPGETAQAAPKGNAQTTLRQKDRHRTRLWKAACGTEEAILRGESFRSGTEARCIDAPLIFLYILKGGCRWNAKRRCTICTWSWAGASCPSRATFCRCSIPRASSTSTWPCARAWGCSTFRTWARCSLRARGALKALGHLMANDMTGMVDGQVRYSPMLNEEGGIVDDLVVCRFDEARYMAVVNAANREKDVNWMRAHLLEDVTMTDVSDAWAQLALQGPKSKELLLGFLPEEALPKKYYHFVPEVEIAGVKCMLSRTGYTGEWGYELYCRPRGRGNALPRAVKGRGRAVRSGRARHAAPRGRHAPLRPRDDRRYIPPRGRAWLGSQTGTRICRPRGHAGARHAPRPASASR